MKRGFDPEFKIKDKLLSLGFTYSEKERETVYMCRNTSERFGNKITIYLHDCNSVLKTESICTSISVFIDDDRIYMGMRPYNEDDFNYLYSSLFPSLEYSEKLQMTLSDHCYHIDCISERDESIASLKDEISKLESRIQNLEKTIQKFSLEFSSRQDKAK